MGMLGDSHKWYLEELHTVLLFVLEAAEMLAARALLIEQWHIFTDKGLDRTIDHQEFDYCESPALTFLERLIQGLRMSVSAELSSEAAWTLSRLEAMLQDTAALVHRRKATPGNEIEVQEIMHDYLSASFPDFVKNPSIGGTVKKFKPDCGVRGGGGALEVKF